MKKTYLLLGVILFIIILVCIIYPNKKVKTKDNNEEFTIIYTYGGGYGTITDTIYKIVTIKSNGDVTFQVEENKHDIAATLEYKIAPEEAKELYDYLIDNNFLKLKEKITDNGVTDYTSSYIEIKSDSVNKKVGGYAASLNKKYAKFENKVIETIGKDKIKEFDKKVSKA